jgi:acetyl-CoA synthetase
VEDLFRAARDFLLANRSDYENACAGFRWPALDHFNWALDWFDGIGRGERRHQTALWVVGEDGTEAKLSFADLSERSSRIANYLYSLSVRRGDRILAMLPNVPELWEFLLAAIKLGAVVSPTSTLLDGRELAERILRGNIRHLVTIEPLAPKFEPVSGCTRILVGAKLPGWHEYEAGYRAAAGFKPDGDTR